jgi:hypothetical protein
MWSLFVRSRRVQTVFGCGSFFAAFNAWNLVRGPVPKSERRHECSI